MELLNEKSEIIFRKSEKSTNHEKSIIRRKIPNKVKHVIRVRNSLTPNL